MKRLLVTLAFLFAFVTVIGAQGTKTVGYDVIVTAGSPTLAQVQSWAPQLYVNTTAAPFTATPTCATSSAGISCTFVVDFTAALTPTGNQTFQLSLKDNVLGEGPKGAPLVLRRPDVPTNLRFP